MAAAQQQYFPGPDPDGLAAPAAPAGPADLDGLAKPADPTDPAGQADPADPAEEAIPYGHKAEKKKKDVKPWARVRGPGPETRGLGPGARKSRSGKWSWEAPQT